VSFSFFLPTIPANWSSFLPLFLTPSIKLKDPSPNRPDLEVQLLFDSAYCSRYCSLGTVQRRDTVHGYCSLLLYFCLDQFVSGLWVLQIKVCVGPSSPSAPDLSGSGTSLLADQCLLFFWCVGRPVVLIRHCLQRASSSVVLCCVLPTCCIFLREVFY
jgi:hypothetical protein